MRRAQTACGVVPHGPCRTVEIHARFPGYITPDAGDIQLSNTENRITFQYVAEGTPGKGSNDGEVTPGKGSDGETTPAAGNSATPAAGESDLIPTGGFDAAPVVIGSVLAMLLGAGVLLMVRLRHRSVSAE